MPQRLKQLTDKRVDVAFESTLASRTFAPWIRGLMASGYRFHLFFLYMPSADACIERVKDRVGNRGHFVPDETIRKRYEGGLKNFFELYTPLATHWVISDSSPETGAVRIAEGGAGIADVVFDHDEWDELLRQYGHAKD